MYGRRCPGGRVRTIVLRARGNAWRRTPIHQAAGPGSEQLPGGGPDEPGAAGPITQAARPRTRTITRAPGSPNPDNPNNSSPMPGCTQKKTPRQPPRGPIPEQIPACGANPPRLPAWAVLFRVIYVSLLSSTISTTSACSGVTFFILRSAIR